MAVHHNDNLAAADGLVDQIKEIGRNAVAVQAEFAEQGPVRVMRDTIAEALGLPSIIVANAVVFLASPQASLIPGVGPPVCGGTVRPSI